MAAVETKLVPDVADIATATTPEVSPAVAGSSSTSDTLMTSSSMLSSSAVEEHIFKSRLPDIPISNHLPLHSYLFEKVDEFGYWDRPCLISASKTYTYAETHMLCRKTGAGLHKLGINKGDVIMILLQNSPEFVFSFIGASMIGAVSTTANPFYTSGEIFKQLKAANAKLVVTQSQFVNKLRDNHDGTKIHRDDDNNNEGNDNDDEYSYSSIKVVTIDDDHEKEPAENCIRFSELWDDQDGIVLPEVEISPDEAVTLPFSSGTTGLPKGVVLTHKSLTTSVAQQVDGDNPNLYLTSEDVLLCVLPLFHIFSLNSVLMAGLRAGSAILIMGKFEIAALLELIQKHRVSVAMVVPPIVLALANNPIVRNYDLTSIRIVLSGAAPLGKDLEDALRQLVPNAVLGQGYGMTEAGPVLSMCPAFAKEPFPTKPGSCGVVVRNAEMKIIDPDTSASLGYNQPGEICIRGQQIMKGYLNDPTATAATIDAQGWLHTGDIGFVDHDHEVFIVDRVKEIIKYKGFQVAPAELEDLLVNHPTIADAAVVSKKDEVAGEVPVAFVVRSNGSDSKVTEEEVKEYIAKQVVFYKKLHKVYFVDVIPKSPSGKILRRELRARLASPSPLSSPCP